MVTLTAYSLPGMTSQVGEKPVYRNHTAPHTQLATFLGFCLRTECHLMREGMQEVEWGSWDKERIFN